MSELTVVYATDEPPVSFSKSIFLAGPSPRDKSVPSWRPRAIELLREAGSDGVVFVPEYEDGDWRGDKDTQIKWEEKALHLSDCVVFWIPRNLETMPGFTTNIEFGRWEDSGRIVVGSPDDAVRNDYLLHYAAKLCVPTASTLHEVLELAIEMVGSGATRSHGEREVPLYVWNTPSFQQWYGNLRQAGNSLEHARVVWTFRVGPTRQFVFIWALHVSIYVTSEDRYKTNEVVLARPDISTILMYQRAPVLDDSLIVLIKEFRSPVSNGTSYVMELAGGSSFKQSETPLELAAHEALEESGLAIDASRFSAHESRQMVSTLSTHKAHLFSVEVSDEEIEAVRRSAETTFGVAEDTERTYVTVSTLGEIRRSNTVDWSMLGMILQVLA